MASRVSAHQRLELTGIANKELFKQFEFIQILQKTNQLGARSLITRCAITCSVISRRGQKNGRKRKSE